MALKLQGYVDLPAHVKQGGFDHAAVHTRLNRLYVAHTANDAVDVIDCESSRYLRSIPGLPGVAGALVAEGDGLLFTSNRGEDTVSILRIEDEHEVARIKVGVRPNGLAFHPKRGHLLAANVGNPEVPNSFTLSIVDVNQGRLIASIPVSGRTRWTVYDPEADAFYVNVATPPQIVVVDAGRADAIARTLAVPVEGPHGLDLDQDNRRLFCACDAAQLVTVPLDKDRTLRQLPLSGTPDVIFYNHALHHLYVAIGEPGVIDVIDTEAMKRLESVPTESGAHTIAFDVSRNNVYAFLPGSHRAAVYLDAQ